MTADISIIRCRPDLFVIVGPDLSEPVGRAVDTAIRCGGDLDEVLGALTSDGLANAPAFAAAEPAGDSGNDARILVRGNLQFDVEHRNGDSSIITPGRSTTWKDDIVNDVRRITASVGPAEVTWVHPAAPAESPEDRSTSEDAPGSAAAPTDEVEAPNPPTPPKAEEPDGSEPADDAPVSNAEPEPDPSDGEAAATPASAEDSGVPAPPAPKDSTEPEDAEDAEDDPYLSNLLDYTVYRDVESAAVRSGDRDDAEEQPGPPDVGDDPGTTDAPRVDASRQPEDATLPVPPDESAAAPQPSPRLDDLPPPPGTTGIISAVPGSGTNAPSSPPPPPPPPGVPGANADVDEPMIADGLGDNDGHTIVLGDIPSATGGGPGAETAGTLSLRCTNGHLNPPTAVQCRSCAVAISDRSPIKAIMPVVARLEFETGLVIDVDRTQVIGRQPTAEVIDDDDRVPNLVTLQSPDRSLSGAHLAIRLEGWDILVEDLGSTNGTEVLLPQREPERLREFNPKLVVPGTTVTMGRTVAFRIEVPA